jgi:hypothetical protein
MIRRLPLILVLTAARFAEAQNCLPTSPARVDVGPQFVRLHTESAIVVEFNRTTRAWRRVSGPPRAGATNTNQQECLESGDSLIVAPGVRLVARESIVDGAILSLRHAGSARDIPVKIADRLRPKPRPRSPDDDPDRAEATEFSPYIASWLRDGDLIWLGLYGSETNPGNYLGGLLRYSLRTRALTSFAPMELREVLIPSMAVAGGTLWMATQRRQFDEYGPDEHPGVGLVQLRRDGSFRAYSADSTPLPSDRVEALGGVGDTLWVVTRAGVAVLDTRTMGWDRRFFRDVFTLDSVYVSLITGPPDSLPPREHAREMAFVIMDELGLEGAQRARFVTAASQLDPELLANMLGSWKMNETGRWGAAFLRGMEPEFVELLRTPALLPFVRQSLRDGGATYLASLVLRQDLTDSLWRAELRSALRTARTRSAVSVAQILTDSGDAVAHAWVRERMADRRVWSDTATDGEGSTSLMGLLWIAHQHPDRAHLPAFLDMIPAVRPTDASRVIGAIWQLKDGPARATAGRRSASIPRAALAWLGYAMNSDSLLDNPAGIAAKREVGEAALKYFIAMGDLKGDLDVAEIPPAIDAVADAQHAAAVPLLLQLIDRNWYFSERANEGLIRLTGVEPPAGNWYQVQAKAAAFWKTWWTANASTFTPVAPVQGLAALERWKSRSR